MAESQKACHFGGGWDFEHKVDEYHLSNVLSRERAAALRMEPAE